MLVGALTGTYYTDQYSSNIYVARADATVDFEWGYGAPFSTGFPTGEWMSCACVCMCMVCVL